MNREYRMGKRFQTMKNTCMIAGLVVIWGFYFIYRVLFQNLIPALVGWPMALVFVGVSVLALYGIQWVADKLIALFWYEVTDEALISHQGLNTYRYEWKDFTAVRSFRTKLISFFPVIFTVNGKQLELNQYTSDIYRLAGEIFDHIQDHVDIPKELRHQADTMRGIGK